jgi:predicted GIY-YIG superfamily endonuclease
MKDFEIQVANTMTGECPQCGSERVIPGFGGLPGYCLSCDYSESPQDAPAPVADPAPTIGGVYLIHFAQPYGHAQHYLGFALDIKRRVERHRAGHGARLLEVVHEAGISFDLVRTWPGATRWDERRLKSWHQARQLCPVCQSTYHAGRGAGRKAKATA